MITVKEEFLTEEKTQRALSLGGESVIRMWLAMKGYTARKNTGGFVPDDAIDKLAGAPKRPRAALKALVECGLKKPDGSQGSGLVDPVEHGWQLHDYEDHGTPVEVEADRRKRAREQKRARRLLLRHQDGACHPDCPHCVRGQTRTDEPDRDADSTPDGPRTRAGTRPPPRGGSQPSPAQPSPDSGSGQAAAEDLTAEAPAEPEQQPQPQARIPCPEDLRLTDGQRRTLETAMIPADAIDALTVRFVAKATADPGDIRTLTAWRKSLSAAISGDWNDPRKRPKRGRESEQFTADDAIARADYLRSIGQ